MKLELLKKLGLDTEEGLACCADDEEFYGEMLREYVTESEERAETLEAQFAARDWDAYRVAVHAAKSTSRMIGALELSLKARELERAASEKEEAFLLSGHERFLRELREFTAALADVLG